METRDGVIDLTLNSAERGPWRSYEPEFGTWLILDVTVVALDGEVSMNPAFFTAQDVDGYVYNGELGGVEPSIGSTPVLPGQMRRGKVTLDVPDGPVTVSFTEALGEALATFPVP